MDEPGSTQFLVMGGLVFLSALFSAAETALTSLSAVRVRSMQESGRKGAKDVERLTRNLPRLLSAILIGNNLANVAAASIAASIAIAYAGNDKVVLSVSTAAITVAILVFGEIMPKMVAVKNAERIACLVAKPMRVFVAVFTPVSVALNFLISGVLKMLGLEGEDNEPTVTESDIKNMVDVGHEEGVVKRDEQIMINNVFAFDNSRAKDVMVPRTDIAAVALELSYRRVMDVFHKEQFSRLPVYKDDMDHIVGILYLKDIIFLGNDDKSKFCIDKYMRKPYFSYESKPINMLFSEMRTESIPMAVILDEYGGTSGIVTIEDLVEEIVGEIYDEYDDGAQEIEHINANEYTVEGAVRIDDFNEMAGTEIVSEDYDSIGGYVVGLLGKIPDVGESVTANGVSFTIKAIGKNRVEKLHVIYNRTM